MGLSETPNAPNIRNDAGITYGLARWCGTNAEALFHTLTLQKLHRHEIDREHLPPCVEDALKKIEGIFSDVNMNGRLSVKHCMEQVSFLQPEAPVRIFAIVGILRTFTGREMIGEWVEILIEAMGNDVIRETYLSSDISYGPVPEGCDVAGKVMKAFNAKISACGVGPVTSDVFKIASSRLVRSKILINSTMVERMSGKSSLAQESIEGEAEIHPPITFEQHFAKHVIDSVHFTINLKDDEVEINLRSAEIPMLARSTDDRFRTPRSTKMERVPNV